MHCFLVLVSSLSLYPTSQGKERTCRWSYWTAIFNELWRTRGSRSLDIEKSIPIKTGSDGGEGATEEGRWFQNVHHCNSSSIGSNSLCSPFKMLIDYFVPHQPYPLQTNVFQDKPTRRSQVRCYRVLGLTSLLFNNMSIDLAPTKGPGPYLIFMKDLSIDLK